MSGPSDNPFWDFSLSVYGRPDVARACLALQERHGLDVNLLLLCCWAGVRGHALTADELADLAGAVGPWQKEVVVPLRAARRWLKAQTMAPADLAEPLRARIKEQELAAERIEQRVLADGLSLDEAAGMPALAATGLMAYLLVLGVRAGAADQADLAALLAGCFAGLTPPDALRLLA
jgi:uncharacterized protein (TIGR02444 family)